MKNPRAIFIKALASWLLLSTGFVTIALWQSPVGRAVLGMGWGLIVFWIFVGGGLMHRLRDSIRLRVAAIRLDWRISSCSLRPCSR